LQHRKLQTVITPQKIYKHTHQQQQQQAIQTTTAATTVATRKNHDGRRGTHVQRQTHAGQNDGDHQMWTVRCNWDCIEAVRSCDGMDVTTKLETKRICSNKPTTEISQKEGDH
jgi:hypothetical protein